jgi:hypothetical protein
MGYIIYPNTITLKNQEWYSSIFGYSTIEPEHVWHVSGRHWFQIFFKTAPFHLLSPYGIQQETLLEMFAAA